MHLRRALLLFAVVLALAAIAASVSRERDDSPPREPPPAARRAPEAAPGPERATSASVRFSAGGAAERRSAALGRALEVLVSAREPGIAEIPALGLSGAVNPGTPARFALLRSRPSRYRVAFTPAADDKPRLVGTLTFEP